MSAYSDAVAADSPAGYWRLGDVAGPTVTATNGSNLTALNGPTFGVTGLLTGDGNTAITFASASSQQAQGNDAGLPTGNGAWTVEAWIKTTTAGECALVAWGTSGASRDVALATLGGQVIFDTSSFFHQFGGTINDDVRHHVALTWNGTTMLAYVDGVQVGSGWAPGAFNLTLAGATGAKLANESGHFYNGTLDEVAVYPSTLTPARIAQHYSIGIAPPAASTGFDGIATALAARFGPAAITPPTGYRDIRSSTPNAAEALGPTPCVLVFVDEGDFDTGNGTRLGVHRWLVRFYYDQAGDLERSQTALRQWLTVLVDQLRTTVQLGGIVTRATVDGYRLGFLSYAGEDYTGIELRVGIVLSEGWAAVA